MTLRPTETQLLTLTPLLLMNTSDSIMLSRRSNTKNRLGYRDETWALGMKAAHAGIKARLCQDRTWSELV